MRRPLLTMGVAIAATAVLAAQGSYVSHRVYDSTHARFADFETLAADAAKADVVFVGEEHDDAATHRLELALLEGLMRRHVTGVLSLEMFERDAADSLARFAAGQLDETAFLSQSRPWPQYATDYKPLMDVALAHGWPVVAANVPREIAAAVSKGGLGVLASRSERERAWFATDLQCEPKGGYFDRFKDTMSGHTAAAQSAGSGGSAMDASAIRQYYESQCLKDETMAESIAQAQAAHATTGQHAVIVHVTGAFHVNYGQGTVERTRRRLPGKRMFVVSLVPTPDLDAIHVDKDTRKLADYVVFTYKRASAAHQ